jgi:hemolysin activation/secretion protein
MKFFRRYASRYALLHLPILVLALGPLGAHAETTQSEPAPAVPAAAPTAQKQGPQFDILDFQVEGNTTLDQQSIERAVYPFMGEHKTITDVEAARTALETAYREKGYGTVSVKIPEQQVANGQVILQVQEGRVERLEVVNAKYYSQGRILDKVESLQEGKVPYFPDVQRQLAEVNTSADRKVSPLLRPGREPGTTDVDLEVSDSLPLHGSVSLDDYYTPLTKALRLTGAIEYDNLFQRDQKIALLYQTSPQDTSEVKLFSLSYTVPIAHQYLALSFVRSDSATVAGVGGVNLFGRGKIIGVHDIIPLSSSSTPDSTFSQSINVGADYKDFDENVTVGTDSTGGFSTPVRYVPFTAAYSSTSTHGTGRWDFTGSMELAIRDFGNTAAEFDAKRYKALSNFAILKLDVARTQPLWSGISAYGRLDLQIADQPLVSNEQLVVGGNGSVRGYLTASEAGDSGAQGTLELRTPNLFASPWYSFDNLESHVFVDGAYVRIISPLPEQLSAFELLSTGIGLRLKRGQNFNLDLDFAWPTRAVLDTRAWSPRLQGSATVSF